MHDNTGIGLLHAIVKDLILRTERTLAENVQKRAKEQTVARRAAAAKPVAATRKPVVAVASRRGKTHTSPIPARRQASAASSAKRHFDSPSMEDDDIVGLALEDQTTDKEKRQARGERFAQWLKPLEV